MQLFNPSLFTPETDTAIFNRHLDWFILDGQVPESMGCKIGQTQTEDQILSFATFENGQSLYLVENVDV